MNKLKVPAWNKLSLTVKQLIGINLVIFVIMSLLQPDKFLTLLNLESMCFQFPEIGLLALGIGIASLTAGVDLSIVAIANLVATINGIMLLKFLAPDAAPSKVIMFIGLCFLNAIVIAIIGGSLNGFLIAKQGVFPILATLGTQYLFTGISMILTKGQGVYGTFPKELTFLGSGKLFGILPMPLFIFIIALIICYLIIHWTPHGMKTQLFGANNKASFYSGIDNVKTLFGTYLLSALLGCITGILILAKTNSAKYDYGSSYVMQALLASAFAGISPLGGKGNILNIFLSVFAIQMLDSGFNFMKISSFVRTSTYGILLICSILVEYLISKYNQKKLIKLAELESNTGK